MTEDKENIQEGQEEEQQVDSVASETPEDQQEEDTAAVESTETDEQEDGAAVEVPETDEQEETAPDETPAEPENPNMAWYAIHTYSGYENRVRDTLQNVIRTSPELQEKVKQVLIPTEEVAEIRDGKKRISSKKLFPGYVIVEMELDDVTRTEVRATPGVTGFVGSRNTPTRLSKEEVDVIMNRMTSTEEAPRPKVVFECGERVKVIEGPFFNFTGYVSDINEERGRVTVMVDILGRSTPVELDFLQVEKL